MTFLFVHHYMRMCRKNILQAIFDSKLEITHNFFGANRFVYRYVLRRNLHITEIRYTPSLCHLKSRGVVQLSGKDTPQFLQGLVTNNVLQLTEKSPSIQYCMMLNVQGRVLYDLFVYNVTKPEADAVTFLVDVDCSGVDDLVKILKKYKIRKKVDISDVSNKYRVWAQFGEGDSATTSESTTTSSESTTTASANTFKFHDPRVPVFASRIITDQDNLETSADNVPETDYRKHRYQWGIPEGVADLPSGKCLPLESNLEYMNGVNFHKGCYVGQELTARTFHTGVIRKRLVPITIGSSETIEPDATIITQGKGKNAGKFRNAEGQYGICLLRLEHVEDDLQVVSQEGDVISLKAHIPKWWPSTS